MRLGIYIRNIDLDLPTISWMHVNGFDSFKIYPEESLDDFGDISEKQGLNHLFFDAELSELDGVFVSDLKIISPITVKILQVLLEFQKFNLTVYHSNGCILPDDKMIQKIHDQIIEEWTRIKKDSLQIDFNDPNITNN